jgi:hypothetical protein
MQMQCTEEICIYRCCEKPRPDGTCLENGEIPKCTAVVVVCRKIIGGVYLARSMIVKRRPRGGAGTDDS